LPFHHTQAVAPSPPGDAIWSVKEKEGGDRRGREGLGGKGRGENVEFYHLLLSNLTA